VSQNHKFFYGRIHGREKKRPSTEYLRSLLPHYLLKGSDVGPNLSSLFGDKDINVWLEIGFGGGEHLATQMQLHPNVCFIGIEPFETGMCRLLRKIHPLNVLADMGPSLVAEQYYKRLRLVSDPAQVFLPCLPAQSISRIFILFPDPWPKRKHHKRRLLNKPFLDALYRVMTPQSQLFLASDHQNYVEHMWHLLGGHPGFQYVRGISGPEPHLWGRWPYLDESSPCEGWPLTRYGEKALIRGLPLAHMIWERSGNFIEGAR
jgi:tRNA (guanine-N7-)-methyltransferase